jgi:hypothetical protein
LIKLTFVLQDGLCLEFLGDLAVRAPLDPGLGGFVPTATPRIKSLPIESESKTSEIRIGDAEALAPISRFSASAGSFSPNVVISRPRAAGTVLG